MSNEEQHAHLSRRNGAATLQTLREQDILIREQKTRIDGLMDTIASLHLRVTALENENALRRVKELGRGPTVK